MGSDLDILTFERLLRSDSACSTSQNVFLNLAGRALGKFLDERDAVRRLEMGEVRPHKLANFFQGRLLQRLQLTEHGRD